MKQEMSLDAPPRGKLPEWGQRVRFDKFFVELVPAGARRFNVRLSESFASISFDSDEGRSSLAGDRLRSYDRRPYEYIVAPANFPLRGESSSAPEVLAFVFDFDAMKADIAAALQVSEGVLEPRVIIGDPKPFTTEMAQRIRRHMLTETLSQDYLQSLCFLLIVEMMRLPPEQRATGRGTKLDEDVLGAVVTYIDANLESDLTIESLAALSGVATHHFARAFKRKVGEPPHHYVMGRRIEAARRLLRTSDRPIAEIAYATGFSSQSHMTTAFKRALGLTPAQCRADAGG